MSRKDFEAIAYAISTIYGLSSVDRMKVAESIATALAASNPRFKRDRFIEAAMKERY